MIPARIQRRRAAGSKLPPNTVCVTRPGRWGNPWTVAHTREAGYTGTDAQLSSMCAGMFRNACTHHLPAVVHILDNLDRLRGKNLACWCAVCTAHSSGKPIGVFCDDCSPCHADVLLEIANPATPETA